MTFYEWQAKYPGVRVQQMADAPEVAHIHFDQYDLVHWDFNDARRTLPAEVRTMIDSLYTLSDYKVTCDNHTRAYYFLAPRMEGKTDWTRDDYMKRRIDHETYYLCLVDAIGRQAIECIVRGIASPERLARAFETDKHVNNIPLSHWDARDSAVRGLLRAEHMKLSWCGELLPPHTICWSLSESVCVLKAAARRMAEERKAEQGSTDKQ